MLRRMLSNERGLTLIELLVVVVILGIIVAIAIPTVGNIIDNSKKDAHIANAKQIVGAVKMYMAAESKSGEQTITLNDLIKNGYMDQIKDPSADGNYDADNTKVVVSVNADNNNAYNYHVTLAPKDSTTSYVNPNEEVNSLTRTHAEVVAKTWTTP